MYYAYILRSGIYTDQYYYGSTSDLRARLKQHNAGSTKHSAKYKPWEVVWYACFETKAKAKNFENYLKTASGKAFARKRLLTNG